MLQTKLKAFIPLGRKPSFRGTTHVNLLKANTHFGNSFPV